MIAEATPCGIGVTYGEYALEEWYEPFFEFIDTQDVRAVSYINCDWEALPMWEGQGWRDSRVEANPIVKKRWLEEVQKEKYLKASPELFSLLGYWKVNNQFGFKSFPNLSMEGVPQEYVLALSFSETRASGEIKHHHAFSIGDRDDAGEAF